MAPFDRDAGMDLPVKVNYEENDDTIATGGLRTAPGMSIP
jgi:hypothetical protein